MPPLEYAIIGSALCWRYLYLGGPWMVCDPSSLTSEIATLRAQLGLPAYPVLEDEVSIAPWAE